MRKEDKNFGYCRVKIINGDVTGFLSAITGQGVEISRITVLDPLTVSFSASYRDIGKIRSYAHSHGAQMHLIHSEGLLQVCKKALKRPVLVVSLLFMIFLTWLIPTRVLFIQVKGNDQIPTKQLLECAEKAGIRFWGICKDVRSEKVKNQMLQMLPPLQWVGVTTKGCVATVSVIEGAVRENVTTVPKVSNILAESDGIITHMVTVSGNPLCKVGQAVKKGQTLISGYWDLGLTIQATRAKGEIYAMTKREITAMTQTEGHRRGALKSVERKYSIQIGKKLINFYNSSGILPPGCVKMYERIPLSLADGMALPATLIVQTWYVYETESVANLQDTVFLETASREYVLQKMIAGTVLRSTPEWVNDDTLHVEYICHEMIGKEIAEERIDRNGENS